MENTSMRDAVGLSTDVSNPILTANLLAASESTPSEISNEVSSIVVKNKKIVLAASGTRGDVQPYIALGK